MKMLLSAFTPTLEIVGLHFSSKAFSKFGFVILHHTTSFSSPLWLCGLSSDALLGTTVLRLSKWQEAKHGRSAMRVHLCFCCYSGFHPRLLTSQCLCPKSPLLWGQKSPAATRRLTVDDSPTPAVCALESGLKIGSFSLLRDVMSGE